MLDLGEKRRFVRFEIPLTVLFRTPGDAAYHHGVACNFSREGLCLIAQELPFAVGSTVEIKLDVPEKGEALTIGGQVVWSNAGNDRWQSGVRFTEIDQGGKMDVLEYAYSNWLVRMRQKARV